MPLDSLIASSHKEIAGSRTKNRLTVQISYAIQLRQHRINTKIRIIQ